MQVDIITGIEELLPASMVVYRDAVLNCLSACHPEIQVVQHSMAAVKMPLATGTINRYLRYFPKVRSSYPDFVHILDQNNAPLAAFLPGSTYIVQTVHDYHPSITRRPMLYMQGLGIKRANRVVVPSLNTRKDLIDALDIPPEKIQVIPHGVDIAIFAGTTGGSEIADDGLSGHPIILHVGSELPQKNMETLIRTFRLVRDQFPNSTLVRVGEPGSTVDRLVKKLDLQGSVLYRTSLSTTALSRLYRTADVLFFPSRYEGFGLPVLEAMASGCPVVCSDASSMPEVGGDAVLYASPEDIAGFAGAISSVITNAGLRQSMISRGKARAGSFTWDQHVRQLVALYHAGADEQLHQLTEQSI